MDKLPDDVTINILCSPEYGPHADDAILLMGDCGHNVWVAPESKKHLDNPELDTRTQCGPCAMRDPEVLKSLREHGVNAFKGARESINKTAGVAAVDQLFTALNVKEWDV